MFNKIVKNESGQATLSSAILSLFVFALIIGFGETATACFQMVSLQHAVNEGLRAGIIGDSANEDLGRGTKLEAARYVTDGLSTKLITGSSNNFVTGVTIPTDVSTTTKWLDVTAEKQLSFGVLGNLVLGLSDGNKGFSLSATRRGKIEAK